MKRSILVTIGSVTVIVPLIVLALSINENKAEQQVINGVPNIKPMESISAEWGKHYPRQYDSYLQTKKSDEIDDILKGNPALVVMWSGYGFSKDYNAPRGHAYMLEDNINTLRTGGPVDGDTGPMPTACWTCKSPDVPRLMGELGELDYFTGKWARFGNEIVNPIGCADCHDNETMRLKVTRPHIERGLAAEGSLKIEDATHQDLRTLVCAQCHSEYYFKPTEWTDKDGNKKVAKVVTFPWAKGFAVEDMEAYYDDINFVDWTHKVSKTPMLKAQHPGYEIYKTGAHGLNDVSCADCHMPYKREGGVKYSSHNVGNPLDDIANTCLNCHNEDEETLRNTVARKLARKNELSTTAMDVIAKAHLEAGKALELGATAAEMKPIQLDIRHAQWRWDYSIASHGSFFHAPEETLRILATAINKGQDARVKLRTVLARYNAAEFVAPDFSTKQKAQQLTGLPFQKLVDEKTVFLNTLREEWIKEATEKGLYDPETMKGVEFKTSYQ
ncbi:MAG: ammonia-forming cytochrome c nitrite reductase [Desulfobulbaceae bacterium]|uniref:nitrite reductase (cytochrome; ammonia-forming) n=1 Tax=Candidatus Desulfatifera sulfidica TaxID=2841691 RepID=A0A8J6N792_9BACT|nr:ammonia-forming cytochrome c nitrite reductase [Candidatus Desulfatifera sulfidica]